MPASLPPCLANGGSQSGASASRATGWRQGNVRRTPDQRQRQRTCRGPTWTNAPVVLFTRHVGGVFRRKCVRVLSAYAYCVAVWLGCNRGSSESDAKSLACVFARMGLRQFPRKPCPSRPRPPGNAFARPLAPKVVRSGSRSQAAASPSLSPSRSPDPATPSARGPARRRLPPLRAGTRLP